jgi:hypothetical protein
VTAETVAEKLALVAPAATVSEAGTVTAALLLARFTVNPPLAAASFRVTVQASVPAPVIDALLQESVESATGTGGAPGPEGVRKATICMIQELGLLVGAVAV